MSDLEFKLNHFFLKYPLKQYSKGETILNAEEEPAGVYYLLSGFVRFYSLSPDGKELTLNIFKPGSFFPMTWALAGKQNVYFFEAMTGAGVHIAPKKKFQEFIGNEPDLLFGFNQRLLRGVNGLLTRMEYLLFGNASQKVISTLVLMAKRFGTHESGSQVQIQIPLTHQAIADLAGLTRESTSLEMKKLEREGLIISKNKLITLLDPKKLESICLLCRDEKPLPYAF